MDHTQKVGRGFFDVLTHHIHFKSAHLSLADNDWHWVQVLLIHALQRKSWVILNVDLSESDTWQMLLLTKRQLKNFSHQLISVCGVLSLVIVKVDDQILICLH